MIGLSERMGLLRRLTRVTRNADSAEDCLQAAFVRLEEYRRHTQVENEGGFLARAATNIALDMARKMRVRGEPSGSNELLENHRDEQPLQDEVLVARERLSRVRLTLDQLPERTRAIFLMHRFSRVKYSEIAAQFGISASAVEKHIAKASLALADCLDEQSSGEKKQSPTAPRDKGGSLGVARALALGGSR